MTAENRQERHLMNTTQTNDSEQESQPADEALEKQKQFAEKVRKLLKRIEYAVGRGKSISLTTKEGQYLLAFINDLSAMSDNLATYAAALEKQMEEEAGKKRRFWTPR